jgi:hypothetical protein
MDVGHAGVEDVEIDAQVLGEGLAPSMSPHTCATPNGARLILPGLTLFV